MSRVTSFPTVICLFANSLPVVVGSSQSFESVSIRPCLRINRYEHQSALCAGPPCVTIAVAILSICYCQGGSSISSVLISYDKTCLRPPIPNCLISSVSLLDCASESFVCVGQSKHRTITCQSILRSCRLRVNQSVLCSVLWQCYSHVNGQISPEVLIAVGPCVRFRLWTTKVLWNAASTAPLSVWWSLVRFG